MLVQRLHHFNGELAVQDFAHSALTAQPSGKVALAKALFGHFILDVLDGVGVGNGVVAGFVRSN